MRSLLLKLVLILITICTLLWIYNLPTFAAEGTKYYFGLKGLYHYPGGDFDGKDQGYLTIEDDGYTYDFTYDLYELIDNYGAGLTFGAYNDFAAGEISYSQSIHNLAWDGIEQEDMDEAVLEILNIDFKFFQPNSAAKKFKPYGQLGLVFSNLKVEDSALLEIYDETDTLVSSELGDALYRGKGYNLGFGIMVNIGKKLILDGSVIYQKVIYSDLKTLGVREDVPEDLSLTTRTYNLGIKYCF